MIRKLLAFFRKPPAPTRPLLRAPLRHVPIDEFEGRYRTIYRHADGKLRYRAVFIDERGQYRYVDLLSPVRKIDVPVLVPRAVRVLETDALIVDDGAPMFGTRTHKRTRYTMAEPGTFDASRKVFLSFYVTR